MTKEENIHLILDKVNDLVALSQLLSNKILNLEPRWRSKLKGSMIETDVPTLIEDINDFIAFVDKLADSKGVCVCCGVGLDKGFYLCERCDPEGCYPCLRWNDEED